MTPRASIITILAMCTVLIVLMFAVGVNTGEALEQKRHMPIPFVQFVRRTSARTTNPTGSPFAPVRYWGS